MNAPHAHAPSPSSPTIFPAVSSRDRCGSLASDLPAVNVDFEPVNEVLPTAERVMEAPPSRRTRRVVPSKNCHPMTIRAKNGIFKPKAYVVSLEPKSVKQALADPKWQKAMNEEF